MIHWLARVYRRTGIHAAPPGTVLYKIHSLVYRIMRRKSLRFAPEAMTMRSRFGGIPYYNVRRARQIRPVDGLALVFFMGAGDYLMATPLIKALHLAHPDLPIYAYGSSHTDNVNSALVIDLLKINPLINRVFTYQGRPRETWMDYDFEDALRLVPKDFLILPVIYDVEPVVLHRITSLLETFGLPVHFPLPRPIAYPATLSSPAGEVLKSIKIQIASASLKGVVFTHFGARSSGYVYPHAADLVARLARRNFLVVNFSPADRSDTNIIDVDVSTITPGDSIELVRTLKSLSRPLCVISVNSLMWPISAALNIPNLGMHVFRDPSMHQYLYPNIWAMTKEFYPSHSPFRLFLAPTGSYQVRQSVDGTTMFTDYKPEYVLDCFETMLSFVAD